MDIDDTRADLIAHIEEWGGVGTYNHGRLWVRMTDGTESWIDIRSNLATECFARPGLGSKRRR